MKVMKKEWTDEEDRQLWAYVTQGFTASEIGKKMERSRDSIVGRCFRVFGGMSMPERKVAVSQREKPIKIKPKRQPVLGVVESVAALKRRQCKYPLETEVFQFCCEDRLPGLPYCEAHMKLTHRKAPAL